MPQRSITIYTGEQDHEWIKTALETLADDIITDEEAGQRGAKLSKLFLMVASAYIGNVGETTNLMRRIKSLVSFEKKHESKW